MKGYKAFDKDLKCRSTQFRVGEIFSIEGEIVLCESGIHFCEKLSSVFSFYTGNIETRVCEVEAIGKIKKDSEKIVTDKIKIIRELSKEEIKLATDDFKFNSRHCNSGHYNSGRYNSGDSNSGHYNSRHYNSGDYNSGHYNSGRYNSGRYNSGDSNSGRYNSGRYNSGDSNSGRYNSGHYNSGHYNSGHYNSGHYNSGLFNTNEPNVRLFNKECNMKRSEMEIPHIILRCTEWIPENEMTTEQKKADPNFFITGGTLITRTYKEAWKKAWNELSEPSKQKFLNLPNFDAEIFLEITGIDVRKPKG